MKRRSHLRFILEGIEGILLLAVILPFWSVLRRWLRHWGSHPEEREQIWPGDGFAASNHEAITRAINIHTPAEAIWPWIVQLGLGRAGFYSYELIERIGGIQVTNVESIESAWQSLAVGDEIRLLPKAPGVFVADLLVNKRLCFRTERISDSANSDTAPATAKTWSFYIEPAATQGCRLLLRSCSEVPAKPRWCKRLAFLAEEALDFVMEQRLLRTVKRLAENNHLTRT